ncbi:hypothetical protein SDC9_122844 [bioreactor metagenome]|uniref:NADPH-dependent FMN reductase-like domain-containing protein n=1 Tax=bioreactor metagenome TaxID=1076179 RepID=A0A645CFZ9_9ZZZZ
MKVTAVYGNMRRGSTRHCVENFLKAMEKYTDVCVKEYSLPKDMPHFCLGCFGCFIKGEQTCPHYESAGAMAKSIEETDLIILASPVYVYDVSGQMKAFLDHMAYRWMSHRPHPSMFGKTAVVISVTAGAGLSPCVKTMERSLRFWGVRKIFTFKKRVAAMAWEDVRGEKQERVEKELTLLARKVFNSMQKGNGRRIPLFIRFFFCLMRKMQEGQTYNKLEYDYWDKQGWFSGKKPF